MKLASAGLLVASGSAFSTSSLHHAKKHRLPHPHRRHHRKHHEVTHLAATAKEGMIQSSRRVKAGGAENNFCSDAPLDWESTTGLSCKDYASEQFCNEDGSYGEGWLKTWGDFKDWGNKDGLCARDACCACGGGVQVAIHQSRLGDACEEGKLITSEATCRKAAESIGAGYAMTAHWPVGQPAGCHVDGDGKTVWLNTHPEGSSPHPKYASLCATDGIPRSQGEVQEQKEEEDEKEDEEEDREDDEEDEKFKEEKEEEEDRQHEIEGGEEHEEAKLEEEPEEELSRSADPETNRLREAVVVAHRALASNMKRRVEIGNELRRLERTTSKDIDARVEALAGESKSPELAMFLGDMWKEQRRYEIPVYKENLQSEFEKLEKEAVTLEARYEAAKHELEASEDREAS